MPKSPAPLIYGNIFEIVNIGKVGAEDGRALGNYLTK
jgi:hypothetical protein